MRYDRAPAPSHELRSNPAADMVSEIFDASDWTEVPGFEELTDVTYHRSIDERTVRIAIDRPECRNAFRPQTVDELFRTLEHARRPDVRALLAGAG